MRLYTRTGASLVSHEVHGDFEVDETGAIEVPEELGRQLHSTHIGGQPAWETDAERHDRLTFEELDRRRDPETLLQAVEKLGRHAQSEPPIAADEVQAMVEAAVADALDKQRAEFKQQIADALDKQRAEFKQQIADANAARAEAEQAKTQADAALEQATQPTPAPAPAEPKKAAASSTAKS